jgi:hypothetical protein
MVLDGMAEAIVTLAGCPSPTDCRRIARNSVGLASHPFVFRIAHAKLQWSSDPASSREAVELTVRRAEELNDNQIATPTDLLSRCFKADSLDQLLRLRSAYQLHADPNDQTLLNKRKARVS